MSTQQPTTDRIASNQSTPTLTDGTWRATSSDATPSPDSPCRQVQLQFAPADGTRLCNLFDAANRAMFARRE